MTSRAAGMHRRRAAWRAELEAYPEIARHGDAEGELLRGFRMNRGPRRDELLE